MERVSTVGIDLSKNVFQICMRSAGGSVLWNRKVSRSKLMGALAQLPAGTNVFMEACQGAHYWSRKIDLLGLKARQISPQHVKPYVKTQKNDRGDAEAISEAGRCGSMKFVPLKTVSQQELQALQRVRERLMHDRTALMNQMRAILAEHGVAIPLGAPALKKAVSRLAQEELTPTVIAVVSELREELGAIEVRIDKYTDWLLELGKGSQDIKRLCTVPGIGSLTALALHVVSGNPKEFKNGRHFSAFLGLVPRQVSSGGKTKLLGITKRGDSAARSLLIHGARAVVRAAVLKQKNDPYSLWVRKLHAKYGTNHTAVAVANKNARVAWRILTSNEVFTPAKLAS